MTRNWTDIGKPYTQGNEAMIGEYLDRLVWRNLPVTLPMMQGLGINEAIRRLRLPNVQRVTESADLAPFGLLGVECRYSNGMARVYLLDTGDECVVLASDFEPTPAKQHGRTQEQNPKKLGYVRNPIPLTGLEPSYA